MLPYILPNMYLRMVAETKGEREYCLLKPQYNTHLTCLLLLHLHCLTKTCPNCRTSIERKVVYNYSIGGILEAVVQSLPPAKCREYSKRKVDAELTQVIDELNIFDLFYVSIDCNTVSQQNSILGKLRNQIRNARNSGQTFMNILVPWKRMEQKKFLTSKNLFLFFDLLRYSLECKTYFDEAYLLYCELVGLTEQRINTFTFKELRIACQNLQCDTHRGGSAFWKQFLINFVNYN